MYVSKYQSPTGSTGHFAIKRKRGIRRWQQWYQSPTGSTGHFAFEQGDGIETTFVVSIPNGLHWPFCRSKSDILDYKELHGINPQRAPLAICRAQGQYQRRGFDCRINPQRAPLAILPMLAGLWTFSGYLVSIPNGLHWPFCLI